MRQRSAPACRRWRRCAACARAAIALIALEGVFSGSLSWLFNQYDGARPFSALLREAHALGYTEPDPRADLCGADVARKLVILARSAGHTLDTDDVEIENLVPARVARCGCGAFLARADELDEAIEKIGCGEVADGKVLRHLARAGRERQRARRARRGGCGAPGRAPGGSDNLFALTTLALSRAAAGDPGRGCWRGSHGAGVAGRCAGVAGTGRDAASRAGRVADAPIIGIPLRGHAPSASRCARRASPRDPEGAHADDVPARTRTPQRAARGGAVRRRGVGAGAGHRAARTVSSARRTGRCAGS